LFHHPATCQAPPYLVLDQEEPDSNVEPFYLGLSSLSSEYVKERGLLLANRRGTRAPAAGRSFLLPRSATSGTQTSAASQAAATTATTTTDQKEDETTMIAYDVINIQRGLDKSYEPASFESQIYQWWERSGCFQPDAQALPRGDLDDDVEEQSKKKKKPYVLPMPPPNVTGRLHMGHAIFVALQDVLARFHRMRGRPVLWLPGTDHAGIATQLQVEKLLLAEGTSRTKVGRDEFLRRTWMYKAEQGGAITSQLRSLGASADWTRERFTMDDDLSNAVVEAFCRLHDKGLVYRGEYMVNWAPLLQTAVSDLEVEYSDEVGKLYYFKYIVEGGNGDGTR
jgi:valyl-tRNA synthetase